MAQTYHIHGYIDGKVIDRQTEILAVTMKQASEANNMQLWVGDRVLDYHALPLAVMMGNREPTEEELLKYSF